ncbi:MAG: dihydroneopterin aldolase [Candidatus Thermoplasmatota archaeon]|nr:dihydroneopterin aldolase [Candidatus Thermoplasmatota archaeon]
MSAENAETLERAMEAGSMVQPFVESVKVRIDRSKLKEKVGQFDYVSLTGEMLDVELRIDYKGSKVDAGMRFAKEMNYPLMFVKRVRKELD